MKDEGKTPSASGVSVRTRFAPSPTGLLHLGNARIAIVNYILALQHRGAFLLRMEDTDPERCRPHYRRFIEEDLRWLGISWEGEALLQSERLDLYREKALELWEKGWAYPCFCSREELEAHRRECQARKRPPRYSGRCRALSPSEARDRIERGEPFSLRLKVDPGARIQWKDLIKGPKRFRGRDLDDVVLLRSDGTPTYHLAVVVDDGEGGVTHVIRGEDHLANTPYHILLFQALGYPLPVFAHLPLIRAPQGGVLEKREGGAWTLKALREEGYLPLAVVNLLVTLGWNPPHKPPLLWEEILESFSIEELSSSSATFSPSTLAAFNRRLMVTLPLGEVVEALVPYLSPSLPRERLEEAVALVRENASTLVELASWVERLLLGPGDPTLTQEERVLLSSLLDWRGGSLLKALDEVAAGLDRKERRLLFSAVRKALVGAPKGPPLKDIIAFLGGEEAEKRIKALCR